MTSPPNKPPPVSGKTAPPGGGASSGSAPSDEQDFEPPTLPDHDPLKSELARADATGPAGAQTKTDEVAAKDATGPTGPVPPTAEEDPSDTEPTLVRLDADDAILEEPSGAYQVVKIPKEFGRFELLMEMGKGGMATLFLARIKGPEKFEKVVAIKKIHDHLTDQRQFIEMFLDEARIAALIHHPNVATIFDLGKIEDAYFIAMEYVHGQNLNDLLSTSIRRKQQMPWQLAVRIVADAAAGLHAAHELRNSEGKPLNVVHRDVSPQNILVSYDGTVKVVDFGIAFAAEKLFHTAAGTLKGKAAYMSPEQTRGEQPDRRSDIFALGIVLYESVCLERLFRSETEATTLLKVREARVPRPRSVRPDIPAKLEAVMMKALAKNRDNRFATAGELGETLEEVLVSQGEVVSHLKVAKMMDRLFYEKKKFKDKQIQHALHDDSPSAMPAVAMEGTTNTSLKGPESASMEMAQPPRRALTTALAAAGLFAVAAVILAVVLIVKRPGSSASEKPDKSGAADKNTENPRTEPGPMDPAPAARKPSTVTLKVTVNPKKAKVEVKFRGKVHKGHVFTTKVKRSGIAESVEVSAKGYQTQMLMLVPVQDNEVTVNLIPEKPRRKGRRRKSRRKRKRLLKDYPF